MRELSADIELLCHKCVREFLPMLSPRRFDYDDLMQEARLSAIAACRTYNPKFRTKLTTHVVNVIRCDMINLVRRETCSARSVKKEVELL